MNSPLNEILTWYQSLDQEIQKEFFDLFYMFHYDKNISGKMLQKNHQQSLIGFLDSTNLSSTEIISHTLSTIILFDYAFNGRDTEEGWDKSMDHNLDARNSITASNKNPQFIDNSLIDWQNRKYFWIKLADDWRNLKESKLNFDALDRFFILSK